MVIIGSATGGVNICFNTQVVHVVADLVSVGIEDKTILFKGEFVTLFKSVNREYSAFVRGGNNTDDTTTEIKTYDCINAGLSFENDNIKLVFCVEKGFSSLSVSVFADLTSSSINVTDDMKVAEFNLGESTFVQYEIDVTGFAKEECVFTVSPRNEKGEKGEEASVTFIPQSTAKAVTITLDGSVITLYNIDTDATNYLVINDVNMGVVKGDTVDLTAYKILSEGVVSIRILSVKEGSFPSYSNTINVELQVQNDND